MWKRLCLESICNCKNGKYLASIMDEIICEEILNTEETKFNENI